MFIRNKRSSQSGLNEAGGFLAGTKLSQYKFFIFGTGSDSDMGGALAIKERLRHDVRSDGSKGTGEVGIKRGYSRDIVLFVQQLRRMVGYLKEYFRGGMDRLLPLFALRNDGIINRLGLLTIFCVLFSFASAMEAQAQEPRQGGAIGQMEVVPLVFGSKVPEEFWTKEHLFYIEGDTVRKTLEDYRGKALILDFWASWCASCLNSIVKLERLKLALGDGCNMILVNGEYTNDDFFKVKTTYGQLKNKQQEIFMPTIISDDYLSRLFPHLGVPYVVWITKSGSLMSLTRSRFLTAENLSYLIN